MSKATALAFVLHVGSGTLALFSGVVAVSSLKGGLLHRRAGALFVCAMLLMAVTADYLALVRPGQLPNLLIGTFTFYLISTAWLTVVRDEGESGNLEKIAFAVILCLFLPFALLSFELVAGWAPFLKSAVPLRGPVLIAILIFTLVCGIAAGTDFKVLAAGGIRGKARIERHLWRMCLGLSLAAGSAFTNGLPRLLPATIHVPLGLLFVPQFVAIGVLAFWAVRVHFTDWYQSNSGQETNAWRAMMSAAVASEATD